MSYLKTNKRGNKSIRHPQDIHIYLSSSYYLILIYTMSSIGTPLPHPSRLTYQNSSSSSTHQVVTSIPTLKNLLLKSEEHAKRLSERVERRDKVIDGLCARLPALVAYVLRTATAVAVLTEGRLLNDSSIAATAPNTLPSVSSDPQAVFDYIESVLKSTEDCILTTLQAPTSVVYPDSTPSTARDVVTVAEIALDAEMTIGSRLANLNNSSLMSPGLSALSILDY